MVLTIIVLVVLVAIAPLLARYRGAPGVMVTKLQEMTAPPQNAPATDLKHSVWVNQRSGLYYCHDSRFFGRMTPGAYMEQGAALQKGFRPAQGQACP